jgi:anti-anti-sigma factor
MNIKSERKNGILVVAPDGRLDAFEAAGLGKELEILLKEGDTYLVVDMAGVLYLSSGGIRVFLAAQKN